MSSTPAPDPSDALRFLWDRLDPRYLGPALVHTAGATLSAPDAARCLAPDPGDPATLVLLRSVLAPEPKMSGTCVVGPQIIAFDLAARVAASLRTDIPLASPLVEALSVLADGPARTVPRSEIGTGPPAVVTDHAAAALVGLGLARCDRHGGHVAVVHITTAGALAVAAVDNRVPSA